MQNHGVVVPLGALYTKGNSVIGEFSDLIPFSQFCKTAGFSIIQLLPINDTGTQSSPYSGLSAFALHPIYIRLSEIPQFNSLYETSKDFKSEYDKFQKNHKYTLRYDYDSIMNSKISLLQKLYDATDIASNSKPDAALEKWIKSNSWIETYSVYKNLKWKYMQASWKTWKKEDQLISSEEISKRWNDKALKKAHLFYAWCQMLAAEQFEKAVEAVHHNGIKLKGDMPILMNEDSCDAWAYPQYFNQNLRAGAPADGDNPKGQNWGFPTYNWKNLKDSDYDWWLQRLENASAYYDYYRLDHILGFFRIWAIPSGDCNALNGHTEPYAFIKKDELYELGFDDNRIRWLSQPHIPTNVIEDITWNHHGAHKILSIFCTQLPGEELWLFKSKITGSQQFWDTDLGPLCTEEAAYKIKETLVNYWSNRTLQEVAKNKFIPMWIYKTSTSWGTLNHKEKEQLTELFDKINTKNEKVWKKQADEIFTAIKSDKKIKMIPCGEDLGVSISCVPQTMKKHGIYGLKVVRWNRLWDKEGQPYVPFETYPELSVTTTSVHDSSTIRQWWKEEKDSVKAFIRMEPEAFGLEKDDSDKIEEMAITEFTPEIAQIIMKQSAKSKSNLIINPLQDYLFMDKKYWLEDEAQERINIPGTVTKFNWTYRLPVAVEDLQKNQKFIDTINKITKRS